MTRTQPGGHAAGEPETAVAAASTMPRSRLLRVLARLDCRATEQRASGHRGQTPVVVVAGPGGCSTIATARLSREDVDRILAELGIAHQDFRDAL